MASEPTDHSDEQITEPAASEAHAQTTAEPTAGHSDEPTDETNPAPAKKVARKRATKAATAPRRSASKAASKTASKAASKTALAAAPAVDRAEPVSDPAEPAPVPAKRARRARKTAQPQGADQQTPPEQTPGESPTEQAPEESTAEQQPSVETTPPGVSAEATPAEERQAVNGTGEAEAEATVDDEAAGGEEDDTTSAGAVPSFGLLFQAPEPMTPRRRRATSAAGAPSQRRTEDTDGTQQTSDAPDGTSEPGADAAGDRADSADSGPSRGSEDQETSPDEQGESAASRRSRRRGGRGRRARGGDTATADESADDGAAQGGRTGGQQGSRPDEARSAHPQRQESGERQESQESGDPTDSGDPTESGDTTGEGDSSRRRRRRRRGGPDTESEDSRGARARDQVTALRGSTRLEAKKQRRREGREAGRRRQVITEAEFLARRESVERAMLVRERDTTTQIGVLEDGILVEHYVSRETGASMIGNVYLGRVQNVLPSMEAAFVDIGKGRNAVLYAGEVNWDAAGLEGNVPRRIENALSSGDTVLVQVTKDPIGHKGARLTSQVSLPGRFLVYVPEASMTGISRKLPDNERARLKSILKKIVPDDAGVIVRTASEGASEEELTADIERLTNAWERIRTKSEKSGKKKGSAPVLLHGEPDLTVKVIRDVFNEDFTSLVVSGDQAYEDISDYLGDVAPELAKRLTKWTGEKDLFAEHRVDEQLAKALDRKVWLPSGGSLVIDRTEAMTVVDVNTGKFVGSGGNLEETVTKNNIEAAEEIVRQLRLRDIGGIIVVDFIDMVLESNRDLVVRRLLECLGRDRTKHQVAEVTSLGLVQMTRKRVGSGLLEVFSESCAHCSGRGLIVHSDPVDQPAGEDSGRGRGRGRGSAGSVGGADRSGAGKTASNGPTAAQIAAAAHAAALKAVAAATSDDDAEKVAASAAVGVARELTGQDASFGAERATESASAPAAETTPEPDPARASEPTAEPETAAATETSPETAPEPAPTARPRRKRGRVIATAGPPGGGEVRVLTPED